MHSPANSAYDGKNLRSYFAILFDSFCSLDYIRNIESIKPANCYSKVSYRHIIREQLHLLMNFGRDKLTPFLFREREHDYNLFMYNCVINVNLNSGF